MLNKNADHYFIAGCGRCALYDTPQCKVHHWKKELQLMRSILQATPLTEEVKWGVPCYTYKKANVVIIGAFKEYSFLSFFKGALLKDTKKLLDKPGENSQATRLFRFTESKSIEKLASTIEAYVKEAIALEDAGKKIAFKKIDEYPVPEELSKRFKKNPSLKKAFDQLTPGRQKGILLHINSAKQSATRETRIDKCVPLIMAGKGIHD